MGTVNSYPAPARTLIATDVILGEVAGATVAVPIAAIAAAVGGSGGGDGTPGEPGADGLSAYQIAIANGFVGTEADWLASLSGSSGSSASGQYIP